ncbi:MAG: T9SS type A sorting domain-containing protein [Flavobacteriaceae bacterium]|nr:T9SS type A sorting domain-containing protein [Flavobacteriaceae bacterium]
MKIKLFLLTLLISAMSYAQYTAIPDANFEDALSDYDDIPNDGQVPTANINTLILLDVSAKNISDLTGIEDFTALMFLTCQDNQLTSLNVTQNTNLILLACSNNQLTSLDVIQNPNLRVLVCSNNQLTSLDVTQNVNLEWLIFDGNQLTSLDVTQNLILDLLACGNNLLTTLDLTQNVELLDLYCDNNLLTSLDVRNGNNTAITNFSTLGNPNLNCIFVDDVTYSTTNWADIDATSTFVETEAACDNVASVSDTAFDTSLLIYPNPTKNQVNIKTDRNANYIISSISGQILQKGVLIQGINALEISTLSQGIYFIKIKDNQTEITKKLMVQ